MPWTKTRVLAARKEVAESVSECGDKWVDGWKEGWMARYNAIFPIRFELWKSRGEGK